MGSAFLQAISYNYIRMNLRIEAIERPPVYPSEIRVYLAFLDSLGAVSRPERMRILRALTSTTSMSRSQLVDATGLPASKISQSYPVLVRAELAEHRGSNHNTATTLGTNFVSGLDELEERLRPYFPNLFISRMIGRGVILSPVQEETIRSILPSAGKGEVEGMLLPILEKLSTLTRWAVVERVVFSDRPLSTKELLDMGIQVPATSLLSFISDFEERGLVTKIGHEYTATPFGAALIHGLIELSKKIHMRFFDAFIANIRRSSPLSEVDKEKVIRLIQEGVDKAPHL